MPVFSPGSISAGHRQFHPGFCLGEQAMHFTDRKNKPTAEGNNDTKKNQYTTDTLENGTEFMQSIKEN